MEKKLKMGLNGFLPLHLSGMRQAGLRWAVGTLLFSFWIAIWHDNWKV